MILPGHVNLDIRRPADILFDLEKCGIDKLPFPDNHFDRILMSHVFEHINNGMAMMQELWRVAKPDATMAILTPYGSSDNADEDPTHVKRVFSKTYIYFSQCWYGQNDYGYRGDWELLRRIYSIDRRLFKWTRPTKEVLEQAIRHQRNVVIELAVELRAVKPARKPGFQPIDPDDEYHYL